MVYGKYRTFLARLPEILLPRQTGILSLLALTIKKAPSEEEALNHN